MAGEGTNEKRALTILWRIQNFSYWKRGLSPSQLETSLFDSSTLDKEECYLSLHRNGGYLGPQHLGLRFGHCDTQIDYRIDCEWSFLADDDSPLASATVRNRRLKSGELDLPDCPTMEEVSVTRKSSFLPNDTLTVRCRIWKSGGEFAQAEHFSLLTRFETTEHSFVWPIERFSTLQLGHEVTTPANAVLGHEDIVFKLYLTGASLLDSKINCEVIRYQEHYPLVMAVKVSVWDNWQNAINCEEWTIKSSDTRNVLEFVSRKELLQKKSECLLGDVLSLRFVFTCIRVIPFSLIEKIYLGPSNLKREIPRNAVIIVSEASSPTSHQSVEPPVIFQERSDSVAVLQDDFLSLYRDDSLSDFKLRSGDVSFPVHKNVLSARSPVFRAMFSSDMKESGSDSLDVPDVDAHSLNRMLTFLYAGTVDPLQWEAAGKLYYAADKYQVQSLKQQCSSFLRSGITVSNVSDILTLADKHFDQGLTSFVHDFILSHDNEIVKSDEWESFLEKDPRLAGKTMHEIYKKKLELD